MIKVDIISGFLGAGKTTLIKKLLGESLQQEQVVLIENEFGEIGIDGGFLQEAGIEIREMNSGCICCSLVGDFGKSLQEVVTQYHPERIVIEPSGVGKLSDVIAAVEKVTKGYEELAIHSASVVVDAKKCKVYMKNFGEFFENQVEYAKTIILSRTQDVSEDKLEQCITLLREHNTGAAIITTPWDELQGNQILEAMEQVSDIQKEMMDEMREHEHGGHEHDDHEHDEYNNHHHEHHHHHDHDHGPDCTCGCHDHDHHDHHDHHHADEIFTSWGMETARKYSKSDIDTILGKLSDTETFGVILRAKGMVPDSETVSNWHYFDYVPEEIEVREGAAQYTGRICVIGSDLKEDNLQRLFGEKI